MPLLRSVAFLLLLGCLLAPVRAETPPGCEAHWRLTPRGSDTAPRLQVTLSLAGTEAASREWRADTDEPSVMLGPKHFFAFAPALLPLPPAWAARPSLQMCLSVEGLDETQVLASNLHPESMRADRLLRWQGRPSLAREIVVAAGSLVHRERASAAGRLSVLLPPSLTDRADALADEAAAVHAGQGRFWEAADPSATLLLLHPDDSGAPPSSAARTRALLLRAPSASLVAGPAFRLGVGRTALRARFRDGFGPTAYEHQPEDPASAWFIDGFSLFYALRQAAHGGWPMDDFAATLTGLWRQDGSAATALWLPLQWHTRLARGGGIDPVLRQLRVPAAQARATGRLSTPLAGHRLFAALRPALGDEPRRAVQQLGRSPVDMLAPDAFGPCFVLTASERRVQAAPASPACSAWLAGTPEASMAAAPTGRDAPRRAQPAAPVSAEAQSPHARAKTANKPAGPTSKKSTGKTRAKPAAKQRRAAPAG